VLLRTGAGDGGVHDCREECMKHGKLIAVVLVGLMLIPTYLRHRDAANNQALQVWNGVRGLWTIQTDATHDLGKSLSNAGTMGAPMKTHRELHDEVVKKTEQIIDEREQKDIVSPHQQN
jgi:hypothetical protein